MKFIRQAKRFFKRNIYGFTAKFYQPLTELQYQEDIKSLRLIEETNLKWLNKLTYNSVKHDIYMELRYIEYYCVVIDNENIVNSILNRTYLVKTNQNDYQHLKVSELCNQLNSL